MIDPDGPALALVGAEHLHLFEIIDALVAAGARAVAHVSTGSLIDAYTNWRTDSVVRNLDEILADDAIDVVVTCGVPADRAEVAVAALDAGKAVVSAKPAITSHAQLAELRAALQGRVGRPFTVAFTERFTNRAIATAVTMARAGAIGKVVSVEGSGPHTLAADSRPEWFWDPLRAGGILVDVASHQIDQFCALAGDADEVCVPSAAVGNVATPDHPDFEDIGALTLAAPGIQGHHSVHWLSPDGLGTWGDVRLVVTGTTGTLEARANIDVTGQPGAEHLIHVDAVGSRRVDVSGTDIDWAQTLVADLADNGERLMTQSHVVRVCELALDAQASARPWGSAGG